MLDEFGEVLRVLRLADGAPGESCGGAGEQDAADAGDGIAAFAGCDERATGRRQSGGQTLRQPGIQAPSRTS
ncbi:MAG: hypothetical protein ACXVGK_10975 [Mycobacteriaceae bacterium]